MFFEQAVQSSGHCDYYKHTGLLPKYASTPIRPDKAILTPSNKIDQALSIGNHSDPLRSCNLSTGAGQQPHQSVTRKIYNKADAKRIETINTIGTRSMYCWVTSPPSLGKELCSFTNPVKSPSLTLGVNNG